MAEPAAIEIQGLKMHFVAGRLSKLIGPGGALQRLTLRLMGVDQAATPATPTPDQAAASATTPPPAAAAAGLSEAGSDAEPTAPSLPPPAPGWLTVRTAVDNLDLTVPRGSVFGFLGQNGAGKTTTIKILTGLLRPTAGKAWIGGVEMRHAAARKGLGYMPENPYFYEHLKPLETLDFYGRLYGLSRTERRRRGPALLAEFGLTGTENFQVRGFSKGMRQRLGLAQAVMADPALVVLDEPMSGLDPGGRREIKDAIKRLGAKGVTVFFSTHILSDVEDLCDRICLIHLGRKVAEGAPKDLLDPNILRTDLEIETADETFRAALEAKLRAPAARAGVEANTGAGAGANTGAGAAVGGAAAGNQVERRGDHLLISTEDAALARTLLQEVQAHPRARLVAFIPRRENIESYFLRKIGKVRRSIDALPAEGRPSTVPTSHAAHDASDPTSARGEER
ncbi:MAG: ABC transporter ATP-binding protein [Planctomycetota bacterium]